MKALKLASRNDVYEAPIIDWNTDTYTPLPNKLVMNLIDSKLSAINMTVKQENYKVTVDNLGHIKGVIGSYDIESSDKEFGHRLMFRNSYDKSMSFAFVAGSLVWICSNGCVSGEYTYKRIHKGTFTDISSTTIEDVIANIDSGFKYLEDAHAKNVKDLNEFKHLQISPKESYEILGDLFFKQEVISINQLSIIKKEFTTSKNFRHLGDTDFTAYDLYNHITESLKTSHPTTYIKDHVNTHKLFEEKFLNKVPCTL